MTGCRDPAGHAYPFLAPSHAEPPCAAESFLAVKSTSRPIIKPAIDRSGPQRFVPTWRAFEARQQCLSRRADEKIGIKPIKGVWQSGARRVCTLVDTTASRVWSLPGSVSDTMLQRFLLPWLMGSFRHVTSRSQSSDGMARLSFLRPLPESVSHQVLRYVGHVIDDNDERLLIANSVTALERVRSHHDDGASLSFTSLGVHDEQLTPEEYFAYVTIETSQNWDYIVEARRRPRPSLLNASAEMDEDQAGLATRRVDMEDVAGINGDHQIGEQDRIGSHSIPGMTWAPIVPMELPRVMPTVLRTDIRESKRKDDRDRALETFCFNHKADYDLAFKSRPVTAGIQVPSACHTFLQDPASSNAALLRLKELSSNRNSSDAVPAGAVPPGDIDVPMQLWEFDNSAHPLPDGVFPESPAAFALELVSKHLASKTAVPGVFQIPEDQYNAVILAVAPLHALWSYALLHQRIDDFRDRSRFLALLRDAPSELVRRCFFHGPGGSGKTWCLTEVVKPVYERFVPACSCGVAAQNSAARLIEGVTMHHMAALSRGQLLSVRGLGGEKVRRLNQLWGHLVLLYVDEISLTNPQLLNAVSRAACHGRRGSLPAQARFEDHPFGDVLAQLMLGDFMQLNPVLSHTLVESVLSDSDPKVPRVPEYAKMDAKSRIYQQGLDQAGYDIFLKFLDCVVLFKGSHRFASGDPLPQLLDIMRTPGGAAVPAKLKSAIQARIYQGVHDLRAALDYTLYEEDPVTQCPQQVGPVGFFACGFHSAINWEQVSRLQQIWTVNRALCCPGPVAWCNLPDGTPHLRDTAQDVQGQLIYYFQAVDVPESSVHRKSPAVFKQALAVANMSSVTAGLMSVTACFLGGRNKLTKKLLPPLLVQEAPGEVVGLAFHQHEKYRCIK